MYADACFFACIVFIKFVLFPVSALFVVRLKTILLPCIGHDMNGFICRNSNFHLRVSNTGMLYVQITLLPSLLPLL
jgi:hypothetical protein